MRKYIFSNGKIIAEFLSFKDSYAIGELVTGHLIRINLADGSYYQIDGSMNMLYFTSNDCSGDIYINSGSLLPNEVFNLNYYDQVISQIINAPYITSQEYYSIIYKSSAWRTTDYQSNGVYGSCSKNSDTDWETSTFKIIPNDSLITGISTNAQETPISIKNK